MPLNTQIIRNGEPLRLSWSGFHVAAMALASGFDSGEGPLSAPASIYACDPETFACYPDAPFPVTREIAFMLCNYGALSNTPLNHGKYVLKYKHQFCDMRDGEILLLLPGDELIAYRN